jgi:hypothetical protein
LTGRRIKMIQREYFNEDTGRWGARVVDDEGRVLSFANVFRAAMAGKVEAGSVWFRKSPEPFNRFKKFEWTVKVHSSGVVTGRYWDYPAECPSEPTAWEIRAEGGVVEGDQAFLEWIGLAPR